MSNSKNQFIIASFFLSSFFPEDRLFEKTTFYYCKLLSFGKSLKMYSVDILTKPVHYHPCSIHGLFFKDSTMSLTKLFTNAGYKLERFIAVPLLIFMVVKFMLMWNGQLWGLIYLGYIPLNLRFFRMRLPRTFTSCFLLLATL